MSVRGTGVVSGYLLTQYCRLQSFVDLAGILEELNIVILKTRNFTNVLFTVTYHFVDIICYEF